MSANCCVCSRTSDIVQLSDLFCRKLITTFQVYSLGMHMLYAWIAKSTQGASLHWNAGGMALIRGFIYIATQTLGVRYTAPSRAHNWIIWLYMVKVSYGQLKARSCYGIAKTRSWTGALSHSRRWVEPNVLRHRYYFTYIFASCTYDTFFCALQHSDWNVLWGTEVRSPRVWKISVSTNS